MKRSLFILFSFCVISNTYASTDCLQRPSCDELGYTQTKKQCACFEKDILPCPFDLAENNPYWSSTEHTYQGQWAFSIFYGELSNNWKHDLQSVRVGLIVENIPQLSESPKVGDVMYTDKSYSSAANYIPSKTAAGIIFAVSEDGTSAKILNLRDLTFSSTNTDNNFNPENPYENTEPKTTWGKINPSASDFTSAQIVAALQKSCSCSCEFE